MIYLSGKLRKDLIGKRSDIGIIVSFRSQRPKSIPGHAMSALSKVPWAADNGCYNNPNLDVERYLTWLELLVQYKDTCLFATAQDVPGDAAETWKRSEPMLPLIREIGLPAALVAQDGFESYPVRWGDFDVLFIGGSDRWKLSESAFEAAREAKKHGLHVHMGRVNSRIRIRTAALALCDSADGTHFVFRPDLYYERMSQWLDEMDQQPFLNYEGDFMKTTHKLSVRAKCPIDDKPDVYDCRIVTARIIPVEEVLQAAKKFEDEKIFQEELCQNLARVLCCEVTLYGVHSGVKTEVTCGFAGA